MLRVPWTAKITNESIMAQIGEKKNMLENMRLRRRLAYFGHVVRGEGLDKEVMLGMGGGSRLRRLPRRRWLDEVVVRGSRRVSSTPMRSSYSRDNNGWRS